MRYLHFTAILVTLVALFAVTEGKVYLVIDTFIDAQESVTIEVPSPQSHVDYWWTPYAYQPGRLPAGSFLNTESALGGQRDIVIGWEAYTPTDNLLTAGVSYQQGTIHFDEGSAAGAYFQWDGLDHTEGNGVFHNSSVFPGALLNFQPGVGAYVNSTAFPERNSDGQTVDLTSAGSAVGIHIHFATNHSVYFYIDVLDNAGVNNTVSLIADEDNQDFYIPFNDPGWVTFNGLPFSGFTQISAIQLRFWTFTATEDPGSQDYGVPFDVALSDFYTYGYEVSGTVYRDCGCTGNQNADSAAKNVRLNLYRAGNVVASTVTDADGTFEFSGGYLTSSSYNLCVEDGVSSCESSAQCQTVTLGAQNVNPVFGFSVFNGCSSQIKVEDVRFVDGENVRIIANLTNPIQDGLSGDVVLTLTDDSGGVVFNETATLVFDGVAHELRSVFFDLSEVDSTAELNAIVSLINIQTSSASGVSKLTFKEATFVLSNGDILNGNKNRYIEGYLYLKDASLSSSGDKLRLATVLKKADVDLVANIEVYLNDVLFRTKKLQFQAGNNGGSPNEIISATIPVSALSEGTVLAVSYDGYSNDAIAWNSVERFTVTDGQLVSVENYPEYISVQLD